jgi:hypothetical protein
MKLPIFALTIFFAASTRTATANTLTVCANGCSHANLQQALDAAAPGDIIELAAGAVYRGNFTLPVKASSEYITIRSARWAELPGENRVSPAQEPMMATIEADNGGLVPGTALLAGNFQKGVDQVDLAGDRLIFSYSFGVIDPAEPLICRSTGELPAPLEALRPYYVRNFSGASTMPQLQLSETRNGPIVNLTNPGSGLHRCMSYRQGAHHYRFQGIVFQPKVGVPSDNLIWIGTGEEFAAHLLPHHLEFMQVIVRGLPSQNGPRNCLILNGNDILLENSHVSSCKSAGVESHAISIYNSSGPVVIRNNYLSAASIGLLTGGAVNGLAMDVSGLRLERNLIAKPGEYLYFEGAGEPARACTPGAFYRQTSLTPNTCANGACWVCQENGTWQTDTGAAYRNQNYLTKGGVEFKGCRNCTITGNIIDKTYAAQDTGNTACMVFVQSIQNGPQGLLENIEVSNNYCRNTWSGIVLFSDGIENFRRRSQGIHFSNLLLSELAAFPEQSIYAQAADAQSFTLKIGQGLHGVTFDHITSRGRFSTAGALFFAGRSSEKALGFQLANSLIYAGQYALFMDGAAANCENGGLPFYFDLSPQGKPFTNSVFYMPELAGLGALPACMNKVRDIPSVTFMGPNNSRLPPSSPFSAACTEDCEFTATDGKDVGVDLDELESAISEVDSGASGWAARMRIRLDVSARHANLRFERLVAETGCSVRLFEDAARRQQHPDTDGGENDDRAGNLVSGGGIQFLLGNRHSLEPDTTYTGTIECGEAKSPFRFRTRKEGSGASTVHRQLFDESAADALLEWSGSLDFANFSAGDASPFLNSIATPTLSLASLSSPVYVRTRIRNAQGETTPNGLGPVEVVLPN